MKWTGYIDPDKVREAVSILQQPHEVFEVRVIGTAKKDILSGYFRDADTLLQAFDTIDVRQRNIYITLGRVKDECFARAQSEHFLKNTQTSSDTDIVSYRWLFVDLDPVRSAGISSSEEELLVAKSMAEEVRGYLHELGFEEPVVAISGNGYHLLYRIDVPNDEHGRGVIAKCLQTLSEIFDTDKLKIDTTNSNPSRICKLHGTLAQKGTSTKDRPHRMSEILSAPDEVKITPSDVLETLAAQARPTTPVVVASVPIPRKDFDLRDFMQRNGMTYKETDGDRAKIFNLDECPFDPNHKNGDAKIFQYPDGAISFKCHHRSCSSYRWQDVREKFEPGVYDRMITEQDDARFDEGYQQHVKQMAAAGDVQPAKKKQPKIRKLKTAESLLSMDIPEPKVFVGVDEEVPFLVEGTCILSAKPKLGKSWFALCMCLAICKGETFLGYKTRKCSTLYLDLETSPALQQKRFRKVLKDEPVPKNFYIENETNRLEDGFVEQIEAYLKEDPDIGVVVIDVFPIIRTDSKNRLESEYSHAYRDITPLNELALREHLSIMLVYHDRKSINPDDPFENILGSTGLQAAASQMISMYRRNKNDPIHIAVKGKTIDGSPEMTVKFEDGAWTVIEQDDENLEQSRLMEEYKESKIREAVIAIANNDPDWRGPAGRLAVEAVLYEVPVFDTPKHIGIFLHRHANRFLHEDGIKVIIKPNGTAGKMYHFEKSSKHTIDTIATIEEPLNHH